MAGHPIEGGHRVRLHGRGKVVVDMSSIPPITAKACAQRIAAPGCDRPDAPGSWPSAADRTEPA